MSVLVCYDRGKFDAIASWSDGFGIIDAAAWAQDMPPRAVTLGIARLLSACPFLVRTVAQIVRECGKYYSPRLRCWIIRRVAGAVEKIFAGIGGALFHVK